MVGTESVELATNRANIMLIMNNIVGSSSAAMIADIVTNTRLTNDILRSSPHSATSHLEAFHSTLNHFTPKMNYYRPLAMYSRYGGRKFTHAFFLLLPFETCSCVNKLSLGVDVMYIV